jgi:type I restriction enzyme S subunit
VHSPPARPPPPARDPGLPKPLADLFPARFVESELGEIPEGWQIGRLGDLCDVEKGLSYKGEGLADDGGLPMVNLGCFGGGGVFKAENIKRYHGDFKERHIVSAGDLLVANTDMTQNRIILGSPALIPELDGQRRYLFTHHIFAFRFRPGAERWRRYLYFTLLQPEFRAVAEGFATGTTVLALPRDGLLNLDLVMPPDPLLQAFEWQVEGLLAPTDTQRRQSRTIAAVRDALLPRLISGEVRVKTGAHVAMETAV